MSGLLRPVVVGLTLWLVGFVSCVAVVSSSVGSQTSRVWSSSTAALAGDGQRVSHEWEHRRVLRRRTLVRRRVMAGGSLSSVGPSLLVGSPLVVQGGESLVGSSPAEAEVLSRTNPEAVAARGASSTAYEGLSSEGSERLAGENFPGLINEPAGGMPPLPEGARVVAYPASSAATLELPGGAHGAVSSIEPIADETGEGQYVPIDLSLIETGGVFEPRTPDTGAQVLISKRLSEGASLSGLGLSVTPVDEHGAALGGEGVIDGAAVFYGDTESSQGGVLDTDTVVKPNTYGFGAETILRSERSPQNLYFKMNLPEGASLVQESSGAVEVVAGGRVIAVVAAPGAHDAEGASVAVSLSLSGDTLVLSVAHKPGQYRMPIVVDPTVVDSILDPQGCCENYNWASMTTNPSALSLAGGGGFAMVANTHGYGYAAADHAYYVYPTQGESHIYEAVIKAMHESTPSQIQNTLSIASPGSGKEGNEVLIPNEWENTSKVCTVWPSCEEGSVTTANHNNRVFWETRAIEAGNSSYANDMTKASIYIKQEKGPSAKLDTTDPTIEGKVNPLYANTWTKEGTYIGVNAFDPGIGISKLTLKIKLAWEAGVYTYCAGAQCNECFESTCPTGEKTAPAAVHVDWSLPEGEDTLEGEAKDAAGLNATVGPLTLKYDNEAPHSIELLGLPAGNEIGEAAYHFTAKATDGESTVRSSGVKSIVVYVDGRKLTENPSATCTEGPCTASGEWAINGEEFAAGANTLTIVATDNAGNVAEKSFTIQVRHATPISVGPGSLNPVSGQLSLSGPKLSMGGGLSFGSTYSSRKISGSAGAFGSQWTSSLAGQQNIIKLSNGSMVLAGATGSATIFVKKGTSFESPRGDSNLNLTEVTTEGVKELVLKNAYTSTSTNFAIPTGGSGEEWVPTSTKGALPSETVTYASETTTVEGKAVTRPSSILGTVPAGVTCPTTKEMKELKKGCRALVFKYAKETKATGENESEWNEYNGRMKEVVFIGYSKTTGSMTEMPVERYLYDKLGRLRAEWDPRISPPLKTIYGYDSEGHATALTRPGQETRAFTYGTIAGDPGAGRLIKVTQAPASAPLWAGTLPKTTEAPKLSGSPMVGTRMTDSDGVWSGSPVVYGYQWMDCNTTGGECIPIPGATNPNYTPASSDIGHTLVAQVTATNGGGSVSASSTASAIVSSGVPNVPGYVSQFGSMGSGNGQFSTPWDIASSSTGSLYVADKNNNRIEEFNSEGVFVRVWGSEGTGNGQFKHPEGVTVDSKGNVWVSDHNNDRVEEFNGEGVFIRAFGSLGSGNGQLNLPEGLVVDSKGDVWVSDQNNNRVEVFTGEGAFVRTVGSVGTGNGQFKSPGDVAIDGSGNVWVADTGNNRLQEFTNEGVFVKLVGSAGSGNGQFNAPYRLAAGPENTLWISDSSNNRIQVLNVNGGYEYQFGVNGEGESQFKSPTGVALYRSWAYVLDRGNDRVSVWTREMNGERLEGEQRTAQPGTTIEYNVPLSGTGLPTMTSGEVEKWAQKDIPTEATAVFPPNEPQGWPASGYKRAYIYYRDNKGNNVNVAAPSEGISTNEYNEFNEVERSLTADSRVAALKEGAKSAEVAKLLDTRSAYQQNGTLLAETVGPRHLVRLSNGKEIQARIRTAYKFDEGAPTEGGPYQLVTKMTQGAQIEGEPEQDIRTTTTSYSGQSNLGWKLRKPTSITTDPSGLKLTTTTLYDETTGNVIETRGPKSSGSESAHNTKTIYYSATANTTYPSCGEHAEWANLVCETLPAKQPETGGLPPIPTTTVSSYNSVGEPLIAEIVSGSATRTLTNTYDEAGRPLTTETKSSVGTSLPKMTIKYDEHTGAVIEQSTSTYSLKSAFNALGQITSYTDADGNVTTYEYELEKDFRLTKINDGKGIQTFGYNETTGLSSEVTDSSAGTFTTGYDIEGNMTSETFPNGIVAKYVLNPEDQPTGLTYKKETHCTENCEWFTETTVPSIHGQTMSQTNSLGTHTYTYDAAGRLTESQATPAGGGCITRRYGLDEDTNITSLTTYQPNAKNECATETSTNETHTYDEADRLLDTGTSYDQFGNMTKVPAVDAGGSALTSSFYVDNQLASQTQSAETIGYNLDPAGRPREIVSTGKVAATETQHYAGPGTTPAWTGEVAGNWTRNIYVFASLVGIEHNGGKPALQLTNLHGDIMATVEDSETATALESTIKEASDYGVPATSNPPRYSWLGSDALRTELTQGISTIAMGARSYLPQIGRFLQTDPITGGSANNYAYTYGDPIDSADPSGAYTASIDNFDENYIAARATEAANNRAAERAAEEQAAREEEEQKAHEAYDKMMGITHTEEAAEEPLGGYPGWACEYAEETEQEAEGCGGSLNIAAQAAVVQSRRKGHSKNWCDVYGLPGVPCARCPAGYEEFPIGGGTCYPSTPPPGSGSGSKSKKGKKENFFEKSVIISKLV
jgi:RHS repeat-associated protein